MNIGIIGCGLIGEKRAKSIGTNKLSMVCDVNIDRAKYISKLKGNTAVVTNDWEKVVTNPDIDMVIVSTTNDLLTKIGLSAIKNNKHVLIEKPVARNVKEIRPLLLRSKSGTKKIKAGFNLRYHPAMIQSKKIVDTGAIGELMYIRGRYGHGGRIGYNKEWRADPDISGGGELIDQGVHLIDLSRWFLGEFSYVSGYINTYFWDMPVEDNVFIQLRTAKNRVAWLHASCSEWKNMFCLEIYGKTGKLQIDGLGGSYGTEKLTYYKMLPKMGPPETTVWEYPGEDKSWNTEFADFLDCIKNKKHINGNINDAYKTLEIVNKIYGGKHK